MKITEQTEDGYYGTYNLTYIGIISFKEMAKHFPDDDGESFTQWMKKYHPRNFFKGYSWGYVKLEPGDNFGDIAIFVPTEEDNLDWKPEGTEYGLKTKFKKKKLPVAVPQKKIEMWLDSLPDGMLTPEDFKNSDSLKDLKDKWIAKSEPVSKKMKL